MNKKLQLNAIGIMPIIFGIFLLAKEGISIYSILLVITGIGILLYSFYKRKTISDFDNPEIYDERDELIQNKASNITLTILVYIMLFVLLINSYVSIPLNYIVVLMIMFTIIGKQLIIKYMEKLDD